MRGLGDFLVVEKTKNLGTKKRKMLHLPFLFNI